MATEKKYNWLSENISSIIALAFLVNTFTIFYLVLLKQVKTSDSTTITIIQTVSNILMLIIGFYFGSSKSGKDKDKQIENLSIKATDFNWSDLELQYKNKKSFLSEADKIIIEDILNNKDTGSYMKAINILNK